MPPFYRGEKLRAQGHTGHLTSVSSALNPHAASLPSHQLPFCSGKGWFSSPGHLPLYRAGLGGESLPIPFLLCAPPPFHLAPFSPRPLSQHLLQGQFKLPIGPQSRSGPLRGAAGEQRASSGLGEGGGGGERGAQPAAPPGLGSGNARPRGARAAASGRRPRVRASCGAARQETASHGARGRPGRRRGPRREGAWGGRGVAFLPMPGAT